MEFLENMDAEALKTELLAYLRADDEDSQIKAGFVESFTQYAQNELSLYGLRGLKEYENPNEVTVEDLIGILQNLDPRTIVVNGNEKNIRVYQGRENKPDGRPVVLLC